MFNRARRLVLAASAIAALSAATGWVAARAAEPANARLKQIVAAAKKEGELSIVTGAGTLGDPAPLIRGFEKYYGLDIDVRFTPGPPMPNVAASVVQDYQTHHPAITDVFIGYANHMMTVIDAKAVRYPRWKDWAPNLQRQGLVSPEGAAVPVMTSTPGIAYNSNILKGAEIPTSFHDLLNPKLKGRVATTPYASSFDRLATKAMWGESKTLAFARELSRQIGGLIRCNELDRIASGEFVAFGLTCSQNDALEIAAKGAPVGFTLASDAPIVMYLYEVVPATAAHPNAAELWINYMSSKEAQTILYHSQHADLSLLEGSKTAGSIHALEAKGIKFLVVDTDFYRTHDRREMHKVLSKVQAILRSR